jgi:amino acid adenylation domain-containing protein
LLAQTRQTALEALQHQDYPFNVLVDQLGVVRDYSRSPLFQVMFAFQKAFKLDELGLTPFALDIAGAEMELAGLRLESKTLAHRASQFDLTLTMGAADDELVASFEYNTDLFEAGTIVQMALHFQILLEGVVTDPQQRLVVLPLLPEAERRQLLVDWNGAQVDRAPDTTVQALFEAQAARTPNAPAVIFGESQLSYVELDWQANQLAAYLQRLGVGPEQVVGICVERSPELIVGLLGVLKTGGAYLPLDPEYPPERLAFMLADAGAGMVLTQAHLRDRLPQNGPLICLDADWPALAASAPVILARRGLAENLACVIYTSGSTGQPKGVLLENGSLVNLIQSFLDSYQPTADDRILPLTSVASASFVGEVLPLLCVGGALVLSSKSEFLDFDELFDLIGKQGVSIVSTVPAVIAGLNDGRADGSTELARALSQLRLLLSGGEALAAGDVDQLLRSVAVVNSYGVTETAVCSTFYKLDGPAVRSGAGVPIGRPIVNTAVYVLDANLNPLPVGCPGELYVAGAGLARGYLGNPGLTAERFVPRPFSPPLSPPLGGMKGGGARMYRTGDLARWLRCGILEYLGRVDHQIKIRGFRVELGEVEAVLKGHPAVRDGVVVSRGDTSEEKRLVAYVVPAQTDLAAQDLYEWLLEQVPPYMVPTAFEMLEALPLTANGKVDLRALPAPDRGRAALGAQYVAPQSEIERAVAAVWQAVLRLDQVGIHDSFFELGGNSLLIAQVHRRLREELKLDLSLADMFKYPTISALAASQKQPQKLSQANLKDEAQKRKAAQRQRQRIMQQSLRSLEKK